MTLCKRFRLLNLTCRPFYRSSSVCIRRKISENISSKPKASTDAKSTTDHLIYKDTHFALKESLNKIIGQEINPYVDEWEKAGQFPAHKIFKILGNAGFLGVTKPIGQMRASCALGESADCERDGFAHRIKGKDTQTVLDTECLMSPVL